MLPVDTPLTLGYDNRWVKGVIKIKSRWKKNLRGAPVLVTFLVGYFFGGGIANLAGAHYRLFGFGLIVAGLLAVYLQTGLLMRRESADYRRELAQAAVFTEDHETCVLEVHVHRGRLVDRTGNPVDPAQIPPNLRSAAGQLGMRAKVGDGPGVDLGKVASMVRRLADDLDRVHHERVSRAN